MQRKAARPKDGRPLQDLMRTGYDGFVEASPFTENVLGEPSHALRDGEGMLHFKLSHKIADAPSPRAYHRAWRRIVSEESVELEESLFTLATKPLHPFSHSTPQRIE